MSCSRPSSLPTSDVDCFDRETFGAWNPFYISKQQTPRVVSFHDFRGTIAHALVALQAEGLPCGDIHRVYDAIPNDAAAESYQDVAESVAKNAARARYARKVRYARAAGPISAPPAPTLETAKGNDLGSYWSPQNR